MCNSEIQSALVTGASGFIGKHLVRHLREIYKHVNILARGSYDGPSKDEITVFKGDVFNKRIIAESVRDVDVVFHLVAKTHDFSKTKESENEYFKINVDGTKNILEACVASNIKHFVYFSSVKVIGEESTDMLDETHVRPTTPYGKSKLMAEQLVAEYGLKYGFKTTSLRLPLVYGPGNKGNIYKMIQAVDKGRFAIIGGGNAKRSMIYVENVVDAALQVVNSPVADNNVYIVTDGVDYTIKELFNEIAEKLNTSKAPFYIPMNIARVLGFVGDLGGFLIRRPLPFNSEILGKLVNSFTLSSDKIKREIGFNAQHNIQNSMRQTIDWYKINA